MGKGGGKSSARGGGGGGKAAPPKTLSELSVGDKAYIVSSNTKGRITKEVTVTKVTTTQITTSDGNRWFKNNGDRFGDRSRTRGWFSFLSANK